MTLVSVLHHVHYLLSIKMALFYCPKQEEASQLPVGYKILCSYWDIFNLQEIQF